MTNYMSAVSPVGLSRGRMTHNALAEYVSHGGPLTAEQWKAVAAAWNERVADDYADLWRKDDE